MGAQRRLWTESLWQDDFGNSQEWLIEPIVDEVELFKRQLQLYRDNGTLSAWTLLGCLDFILGTNYQIVARRHEEQKDEPEDCEEAEEIDEVEEENDRKSGNQSQLEEMASGQDEEQAEVIDSKEENEAASPEANDKDDPTVATKQQTLYRAVLNDHQGAIRILEQLEQSPEVIRVYSILSLAIDSKQLKDLRDEESIEWEELQPTVNPQAFIEWVSSHHPNWPINPDAGLESNSGSRNPPGMEIQVVDDAIEVRIAVEEPIMRAIKQGRRLDEGQRKRIEIRALSMVMQAALGPMRPSELLEHPDIQESLSTLTNARSPDQYRNWIRSAALSEKPGAPTKNPEESKESEKNPLE